MTIDLQGRLFTALRGLYLVSQGTTAKIDANRVNGSKERPLFPAGEGSPAYEEYALRWARAHTAASKLEVVQAAEKELRDWKVAPDPPEGVEPERGSWAWKKRIAEDDRPSREVARLYSVSHVTVCDYRRRYRELKRAA